jgi:hypothetical protein
VLTIGLRPFVDGYMCKDCVGGSTLISGDCATCESSGAFVLVGVALVLCRRRSRRWRSSECPGFARLGR